MKVGFLKYVVIFSIVTEENVFLELCQNLLRLYQEDGVLGRKVLANLDVSRCQRAIGSDKGIVPILLPLIQIEDVKVQVYKLDYVMIKWLDDN